MLPTVVCWVRVQLFPFRMALIIFWPLQVEVEVRNSIVYRVNYEILSDLVFRVDPLQWMVQFTLLLDPSSLTNVRNFTTTSHNRHPTRLILPIV